MWLTSGWGALTSATNLIRGFMKFQRLTTEAEVTDLIKWHNTFSKHVTIDLETTGLDHFSDTIMLVILNGAEPNSSMAFDGGLSACLRQLTVKTLVFHHFKFDVRMLLNVGVDLRGHCIRDTMLLHHLIDEDAGHSLDEIVQERYADNYKEVFWSKYKTFQEAPELEQLEYACKDVIYTDLLYRDLLGELADTGVPTSLVEHIHNLAISLFNTEFEGIAVDLDYLTELAVELKPKILQYRKQMREEVDGYCTAVEYGLWAKQIAKLYTPRGTKWKTLPKPDFNFNSHSQVGELLYDLLKLPEQLKKDKKSKEWRRTTDDDALARIEHLHPLPAMLRQYAEYEKVFTAFVEGTLERQLNGRIYPSFNVNGTVTGRISSSDPNLQQLPSKGDWAKVRGIYVPDGGYRIITCDYAQLEVVIAAHYSHDPNLLKIVLEGASKHDITADSLKIPRNLAKTLNFAMQYQCSPIKVAQILSCSKSEAVFIWNKYWETYAGEKRVIDECKAKVDSGEPIINPFGRRRHLKGPYRTQWEREAAYRQAYSSLIQGTGADCTHYAFYTCARQLADRGYGKALFEVHDEIVISAVLAHCAEASDMLQSTMIQAGKIANLSVPLSVDCSEPLVRWEK